MIVMATYINWVINFLKDETVLAFLTWLGCFGMFAAIGRYLWKNMQTIKYRLRLSRELNDEGIRNFFGNAKIYVVHKDHGKPAEYMKKTQQKIAYVGFWLTNSIGLGGITESVRELLAKGKEVTFVLMNPYDEKIVNFTKEFFPYESGYIVADFRKAMKPLFDFYSSPELSEKEKKRLHVLLHNKPISTAAYLIDWDDDKYGRILIDAKIQGLDDSDGYGMELVACEKNRDILSLYNRLKESYLAFLEFDRRNPIQTIQVNLDATTFEELIQNIESDVRKYQQTFHEIK